MKYFSIIIVFCQIFALCQEEKTLKTEQIPKNTENVENLKV